MPYFSEEVVHREREKESFNAACVTPCRSYKKAYTVIRKLLLANTVVLRGSVNWWARCLREYVSGFIGGSHWHMVFVSCDAVEPVALETTNTVSYFWARFMVVDGLDALFEERVETRAVLC